MWLKNKMTNITHFIALVGARFEISDMCCISFVILKEMIKSLMTKSTGLLQEMGCNKVL